MKQILTRSLVAAFALGLTASAALAQGAEGYLKVFSAVEDSQKGEAANAYPHTDYKILSTDGKFLRFVSNQASNISQDPDLVTLPAGQYIIRAESAKGQVDVTTSVKSGDVTVVTVE